MRMGALRTPVTDIDDDLNTVFVEIENARQSIDRLRAGMDPNT